MIIEKTDIEGLYVVTPEPIRDHRGYFQRMYAAEEFAEHGIEYSIVHINQVMSLKKGTIRGPHMQKQPYSESKLIQCTKGSIFDVSIDLRKKSPTYGLWIGITLIEKTNKMIYSPKGIMHGYQALEDHTIISYSVSHGYLPDSVIGIRWDDPVFNIQWPIKNAIISKKDAHWPGYQL